MKLLKNYPILRIMPAFYALLFIFIGIESCASLHLGVKAKHSNDNTTASKVVSAHSFDSLGSLFQNQTAQMQQLQMMMVDKNVATTAVDEDGTATATGGNKSAGHANAGDGRVSINQLVTIGRTSASGTYYYANDSIYVNLVIGDTIINIHRRTVNTSDLSKIKSTVSTNTASSATTTNAVAVHSDSNKTADTKVHNKQSSSVQVDAIASIGGKGYILACIVGVVCLLIGLYIGHKRK